MNAVDPAEEKKQKVCRSIFTYSPKKLYRRPVFVHSAFQQRH